MDNTQYYREQQEAKRLHDRISSFMESFTVGTLLGGSGIRKLRGAKPLAVFTAIFALPFTGFNFSRGIVHDRGQGFRKDVAYDFLKNPRYNWRRFLLSLVTMAPGAGQFMSATWSPDIFLSAFVTAAVLGILGGLYPAWRATKLEPAEALRYE